MKLLIVYLFSILLSASAYSQSTFFTGGNICSDAEWHLVFDDEFNGDSLDRSVWLTYFPCAADWTDQCEGSRVEKKNIYTDSSVVESNGTLKLIAKRQTASWYSQTRDYTSGVILAKSQFRFGYGKYEIRCKIPAGQGLGSAFWMFGGDGMGTATEIDVFEIHGHTPHHHHLGYIKYHETQKLGAHECAYDGIDFSQDFHVYSFEWDPFFVNFTVDSLTVFKASRFYTLSGTQVTWCCVEPGIYSMEPYFPFGKSEMLGPIANLSLGGNGSSQDAPDSTTPSLTQFEIDYIRVYQRDPPSSANYDCEVILFPNPVTNHLNIKKNKMTLLRIENVLGEILFSKEVSGDETEVDVSIFSKGIYFVEVQSDDGTFASKFIKE